MHTSLSTANLLPPTPQKSNSEHRYAKALESFTYLRPPPVASFLAARDLVSAHFQLEAEDQFMKAQRNTDTQSTSNDIATRLRRSIISEVELPTDTANRRASYHISNTKSHQRLGQVIRDPRSRRALICASTAMVAQQLCGINTIGEYPLDRRMIRAFFVVLIHP